MNRRDFLPILATVPLTIGEKVMRASKRVRTSHRIESPKGKEQNLSLSKVSVSVNPPPPPPQALPLPTTLSAFSITSMQVTGGQVTLSWQGGSPPYQIEEHLPTGFTKKTFRATMLNSQTIGADGPTALFRVQSARCLSMIDTFETHPRYMWEAPLI